MKTKSNKTSLEVFKVISVSILFLISSIVCFAQECSTSIIIKLKNINGGVYSSQSVTLTDKATGTVYSSSPGYAAL